jgi:hypothetical protein
LHLHACRGRKTHGMNPNKNAKRERVSE